MPYEDVFALMVERRSVKRFTPAPVEMDKILQIVQAGTLAPSSGNIQNWSFIIISEVGKIREMYPHTLNQEPFLSAMAAVVVCGDVQHAHSMYGMRGKRLYTIQNCAAAVENMLLAAHALGLGSIWVGAFDEDRIAGMLNIPAHEMRPQAIILLGYPDDEPEPKRLRPLSDVVFFNQYGNKVMKPHLIFFDWATEWRNQAQHLKQRLSTTKRLLPGRKEKVVEHIHEKTVIEEKGPSQLEQTKKRMRDLFENLKKDEYRRK